MKVRVVGASGWETLLERMTTLMLGDRVAYDAGSLSRGLDLDAQLELRSIVLSHAHMDHACWSSA